MGFDNRDLNWDGDRLRARGKLTGFSIVPDASYPTMWRIKFPDGRLSDMVNLSRARDAARSLVLQALNPRQTPPT